MKYQIVKKSILNRKITHNYNLSPKVVHDIVRWRNREGFNHKSRQEPVLGELEVAPGVEEEVFPGVELAGRGYLTIAETKVQINKTSKNQKAK